MLPDGRPASGGNGRIRLWDLASGTKTTILWAANDFVHALARWAPRLRRQRWHHPAWDPLRGAETARLGRHNSGVRALAVVSNDRLASGGSDGAIGLWDLERGAKTTRLEVDGAVLCLASLPGGHLVAGDVLGRLHWLVIVE